MLVACRLASFSLLVVGRFRSLQVVLYQKWVVSGRLLLVVGRFQIVSCSLQVFSKLCRSFHVVSCLLQVVSSCFMLVVGRFRSFLPRCRSFQVVSCSLQVTEGRFRSFLILVSTFRPYTLTSDIYLVFDSPYLLINCFLQFSKYF